jgi:hypothetical protein
MVLAVTALVTVGAAACSDKTGGEATGVSTASPGTTSSSRAPLPTDGLPTGSSEPSSDPSGSSPLESVEPCQLSQGVAAQLDLGTGAKQELVGVRYCRYHASSTTLDVEVYLKSGIEDYVGTSATQTKIGEHDALVAKEALGQCSVVLGVTDNSRVDVVAGTQGDQSKSCELATQVATALEPSLPG